MHGIVSSTIALNSKGVGCDVLFRVCDLHQETQEHILIHYVVAQLVWSNLCPNALVFALNLGDIFCWDEIFLYAYDCDVFLIFYYTL